MQSLIITTAPFGPAWIQGDFSDLPVTWKERGQAAVEAREIMKIGTWYNSPEETLLHLGLPPNRAEGEPGFLGWETTGKRGLAVAASDSHPMAYCLVRPETTDTEAATTPVQPVCTRSKDPNQGVIGTCAVAQVP